MRFLSLLLVALITLGPIPAQTNASGSSKAVAHPALHLRFLNEARSALPNSLSMKGFAVQVTDPSGEPVSDGAVAIRLPDEGATGHFPGNLRAWVVYTDAAGVAHFPIIHWEGIAGVADLKTVAAKGIAQGELVIQQRVGGEPPGGAPSPAFTGAKGFSPALPPPPDVGAETPESDSIFAPLADVIPPAPSKSDATLPEKRGQKSASGTPPAVANTTAGTGTGPHSRRNKWIFIAAMGASAELGIVVALFVHAMGQR
jgi:hypothetical protein